MRLKLLFHRRIEPQCLHEIACRFIILALAQQRQPAIGIRRDQIRVYFNGTVEFNNGAIQLFPIAQNCGASVIAGSKTRIELDRLIESALFFQFGERYLPFRLEPSSMAMLRNEVGSFQREPKTA